MRKKFPKIFFILLLFFLAMPVKAGTKMIYQEAVLFGGTGLESSRGMDFDSSGNYSVVGVFEGTADFDPGAGIDNKTSNGGHDAYIAKYDSLDNYLSVVTFGDTGDDSARGIAFDSSDNYYVVGYFVDTVDFDPGAGIDNKTATGSNDAFISKFDSDGNYVETVTFGGPTGSCSANDIEFDSDGNFYVAGQFAVTVDFDPGVGTDNKISNGLADVFISKYNSDGNYVETVTFGGTKLDRILGIEFDLDENYYVTGSFRDTVDFDPGAGVDNKTAAGVNSFVSKYDSSDVYIETTVTGGSNAYGIAFDSDGNYYIVGAFVNVLDFDPGAGTDNKISVGGLDNYISRFDSLGNYIETKTFGGVSTDNIQEIKFNSSGNFYLVGEINGSVDFDPGVSTDNKTSVGDNDAFIAKYSPITVSTSKSKSSVAVEKVLQTSDTYTIFLSVEPTADVTISIITSDTNQTLVSPSTLTFTASNYSTPQTIIVRGVNNNICITASQQATMSHSVSSSDYDYNNLSMSDLIINITDNNCTVKGFPSNYQAPPSKPTVENGKETDFQIKINNGEKYVYVRNVKLNFMAGSDTTRVAFSEDFSFKYASLYDYLPEMDFQLSGGHGEKIVYAKFYTKYGYSTDAIADSIIYKIKEEEFSREENFYISRLVKYPSSSTVYLISEENKKQPIFHERVFLRLDYKWENIILIDESMVFENGEMIY